MARSAALAGGGTWNWITYADDADDFMQVISSVVFVGMCVVTAPVITCVMVCLALSAQHGVDATVALPPNRYLERRHDISQVRGGHQPLRPSRYQPSDGHLDDAAQAKDCIALVANRAADHPDMNVAMACTTISSTCSSTAVSRRGGGLGWFGVGFGFSKFWRLP